MISGPPADGQAVADLDQRMVHRRAVEAAIWGVPAVNFERLRDGLADAGGDWNQIVYWSRLPDWKNQTLTPNPDVIYLMPFYDTRNGPVVLEIPPPKVTLPSPGASTTVGRPRSKTSVRLAWTRARAAST
ncbi:DUF1254 domain-containing protein [Cupriavidus basilensis]